MRQFDTRVEAYNDGIPDAVVDQYLKARRKRLRNQVLLVWTLRILLFAILLSAWQFVAEENILSPVFVGEPSRIFSDFLHLFQTTIVTTDLGTTLFETGVGFIVSIIVGVLVAYWIDRSRIIELVLRPLITASNSVPRIALVPIFIIWFGLGPLSKIANVVAFVSFTVLMGSISAFKSTDRDSMLLARALGFSEYQRMRKFVIPGSIPALADLLELALIYSFLGSVTAEMLGGIHGLGVQLEALSNQFKTNEYFAVLLLIVIVVVVAVRAMQLLKSRILKWHVVEMRGEHRTVL